MFAFQRVTGFLVVKSLDVPFDQRKIQTIVLGVTPGAFLARTTRNAIRRMQPFMCVESCSDLAMAVETFQRGLTAKLVATGALCTTVEGLMRSRQRSRRNLRASRRVGRNQEEE